MRPSSIIAITLVSCVGLSISFNGELAELECPDDCHCHYFRVNWVTDCSDSNLTHIPYNELSPNVYILDLNDNLISEVGPFPADFKVRRLQLSHNIMTELKKDSYAGLHYLIDADFSHNRIEKVETDAFDDSAGLIHLELQGNPLREVEGPFISIKSLLYLDISNCSLRKLNDDFFANLPHLSTLDLSDNPFFEIENNVFKPLSGLETLKMNRCNLTHISNTAFSSLGLLKSLELSENNFHRISWDIVLNTLDLLETIDFRKSGLTRLPVTMFDGNQYLRTLILAENNLPGLNVEETIGKLQNLDTLDLSDCNLTLPLSEDAFVNVTKIRNLYLSGNTLFASDLLLALSPLTNLHKLSLSNCGLSRLPDTFDKFKSLQELDISHNPLNDAFVKLLAPLETLEYLNMGYSNLSYIHPTSFSKMTSMRRLILSGNDLNSLEAGLFENLTRLESLELNFCGLRRPLNATLFFNNFTYTDLTELQLAGNPLRVSKTGVLLPKQLSRLQTLDLSNCNLTFLSPEAFHWTRNITNLILAGNHFSSPNDLRFLELLPKLEVLDLRFNNLTTFSPKDLSLNPNVEKLKLIGNPWRCDCSVADLWDWASIEKGNLELLEGSTLTQEHVSVGKVKRKKLLVCHYNTGGLQPVKIVMNKTVPGRRPFLNPTRTITANRTWAKYVRESGCEQSPTLQRSPRAAEGYDTMVDADGVKMRYKHVPNTWAPAVIPLVYMYAAFMTVLGLVYLFTRNIRKKQRAIAHADKNN
nr:slit homolog 1 protein-like [Leptinotarsa decemlineata]XP_023013108.1 slit homolog 1 protein-like [Leptinotarsa decemlineata]